MSKEIQVKEFDNGLTLVAYCKGSHKLAIAKASLEDPGNYQLGFTKRQFDYECGWRPNLDFEVLTKTTDKKKALDMISDLARLGKMRKGLFENDYSYRARVGNQYLQGRGFTSSARDADVFESETEPRQRINQMRKSKRFTPKGKVTIEKIKENRRFINMRRCLRESSVDSEPRYKLIDDFDGEYQPRVLAYIADNGVFIWDDDEGQDDVLWLTRGEVVDTLLKLRDEYDDWRNISVIDKKEDTYEFAEDVLANAGIL